MCRSRMNCLVDCIIRGHNRADKTETMDPLQNPQESSPIPAPTAEEVPGNLQDLIPKNSGNLPTVVAPEPSPSLNPTDHLKSTSSQLEVPSEDALLENQILSHTSKTEFQCKICQFQASDIPQFRSHLAAHYVTSADKAKSVVNIAEIVPVSSQLETGSGDHNPDPRNEALASDSAPDFLPTSDQTVEDPTAEIDADLKPRKLGRRGRRARKMIRYPTTADGKYRCTAPGCDFTTKYEFNLQRHEVRHGKRKAGSKSRSKLKFSRNSKKGKYVKPKKTLVQDPTDSSSPPPDLQPLGILKTALTSPTKSPLDPIVEPTENKLEPPELIKSWIEDRKNQQNGSSGSKSHDDEDNYLTSPSGKYKCNQCYYTTEHKFNMKKHAATHSNDRPYGCRYCEYRSRWEQNVKAHERTQHFGIPRKPSLKKSKKDDKISGNATIISNRETKLEQNEIKNKIKVEPNQIPIKLFKIEPADKEADEETTRRSSTIILEAADGNFYCKDCDYVSHDKRLLISHLKRHSDERPFPCTFPGCGYRSKWSHWARAHERTVHGFTRFEQVSGKGRRKQLSGMAARRFELGLQIGEIVEGPLTKGMEWQPKKKMPIKLPMEPPTKKYSPSENFEKKFTPPPNFPSIGNLAGLKPGEKIDCPECGVKCYPRFLQRHMMVHSDEKPFGCSVQGCQYRTKWPADLKTHMKRHGKNLAKRQSFLKRSSFRQVKGTKTVVTSGAGAPKRFKCPDCDYHGATGWHVNRHRLTHGNVPPLSCPEEGCSFTTRDRRYLVKHQIEFHPEGRGSGSSTRPAVGRDSEDKDCRFCGYLQRLPFYVRRYMKGCPGCKKPLVLDPPRVDKEVRSAENDEEKENNNREEASMGQEEGLLADSSGFACMLCDFVGDSEAAALEHAKSHPQPSIKINKLPDVVLPSV